jgi:hypothetical protein
VLNVPHSEMTLLIFVCRLALEAEKLIESRRRPLYAMDLATVGLAPWGVLEAIGSSGSFPPRNPQDEKRGSEVCPGWCRVLTSIGLCTRSQHELRILRLLVRPVMEFIGKDFFIWLVLPRSLPCQ